MLTETERALVELLRADPLVSTTELAERLGTSRQAVRVHLSNLGKKGVILGRGYVLREEAAAVVIGGANVDVKARSAAPIVAATSNPGHVSSSAGGVGRNIAENLARLGTATHLLSAVGTDAFGDRLLEDTRAAGVHVDHVLRSSAPTGSYTAILDDDGELVVAVSDMAAIDALDASRVIASRQLVTHAGLLILDGNVRLDALTTALDLAAEADIPSLVDPVSDAKAALLADALVPARRVDLVTPNRTELAALTDRPTRCDRQLATAADELHRRGVCAVWVSLGARGSIMFRVDDEPVEAAAEPGEVVDVTGAGDAMVAAFAHAHLDGRPTHEAVAFAHAAAALTIESESTVRSDLTAAAVDARLGATTSPNQPSTPTKTRP